MTPDLGPQRLNDTVIAVGTSLAACQAGAFCSVPGSLRPEVSPMQEQGQDEERGVDGREVAGEPWRQVDIGNRTVLGAKRLGNIGERAAESIGRKDQALPGDHGARDCRAAVSPP